MKFFYHVWHINKSHLNTMTQKLTTLKFSDSAVSDKWDTSQRALVKRMCLKETFTKQIQESTGVPERTQS